MTARGNDARELSEMQAEPDVLRGMVRAMIQEVMEEELTRHLGASCHERSEQRVG